MITKMGSPGKSAAKEPEPAALEMPKPVEDEDEAEMRRLVRAAWPLCALCLLQLCPYIFHFHLLLGARGGAAAGADGGDGGAQAQGE